MPADIPQAGATTADGFGSPLGSTYPGAETPEEAESPEPAPDPSGAFPDLDAGVRGARLLRFLERGFLHFDRLVGRVLPDEMNPFLHTGAIAITNLFIATATGVLLLFWYRPSVHLAYSSVHGMAGSWLTAGLLRSLHRYSSDVAMFFALVHAIRIFLERRFTGARWLSWLTGVAAVITLWFVGWTGYWLVWDERGHGVAMGTAKALDVLPIFADPMGRSFLTDQSLNSLLFFVVFFMHMLIPLGMGIFLWLHIARLTRVKFLTRAPLTLWVAGALLLLSLFYPADTAGPARMTLIRESFTMDWWYLLPLAVSDRLGGGALWSILLVGSLVVGSVPWWMARRRLGAAAINTSRCNACKQCFTDCPYGAISMVLRTDGSKKYDLQAEVDPAKCVDCGICAASCDSVGTNISWIETVATRQRVEAWVREAIREGQTPLVAFTCAHAAGADFTVDPKTGRCAELPGYRVLPVPCAGWVHAYTLERALRRGAREALVVACGPGQCHYREGTEWLWQRIEGERKPTLREPEAHRRRIHVIELDRTRRRDLIRMAESLRAGGPPEVPRLTRSLAGLAAAVLAVIVAGGVGIVSDLGYASPRVEGSELIVTFKHPGRIEENCRERTPEELARIPVHMRQARVCDRERASVRMRVKMDDRVLVEKAYAPKGIWHDGNSVAVETIPVAPGAHAIEVEVGDSHEPGEWSFRTQQNLVFTRDARRVIAFDRLEGFTEH